MNTATLIYYLKRHALPWQTAAKRRDSVRVFQAAFAFYDLVVDGIPGKKTLAAFRYSSKRGHRISPHFKIREFRCGCNGKYHTRGYLRVDRDLVRALEKARTKLYPSGLTIVAGYRCATWNKRVGGMTGSAHTLGKAADIQRRAKPASFKGLGFRGIEARKSHGLVTHVDIASWLPKDHVFYA